MRKGCTAKLVLLALTISACRQAQHPPQGAPTEALLVRGPKGGLRQVCVSPEKLSLQVSCAIYTSSGKDSISESFVAVNRQPLPPNLVIAERCGDVALGAEPDADGGAGWQCDAVQQESVDGSVGVPPDANGNLTTARVQAAQARIGGTRRGMRQGCAFRT